MTEQTPLLHARNSLKYAPIPRHLIAVTHIIDRSVRYRWYDP